MSTVTVLRAVYDSPLDLTGVDLFSVLSRSRDALPPALGPPAQTAEMERVDQVFGCYHYDSTHTQARSCPAPPGSTTQAPDTTS
jgi:hypothetical protein